MQVSANPKLGKELKMKSVTAIGTVALLLAAWMSPAALWGQVTADDFLPPVVGGPTDVKQPAKVEVKADVVSAATAQDAINALAAGGVLDVCISYGPLQFDPDRPATRAELIDAIAKALDLIPVNSCRIKV